MNKEIERKMSEIIDWSEIKYHTDEIESYIGKMERSKKDFTGDIEYELDQIKEIFREAEETVADELSKEETEGD